MSSHWSDPFCSLKGEEKSMEKDGYDGAERRERGESYFEALQQHRREQPLPLHHSTVISKAEQKPSQNKALQSTLIKGGHLFQALHRSCVSEDITWILSPLLPCLESRTTASAAQQLQRCEMLTHQLPAPFTSARFVS